MASVLQPAFIKLIDEYKPAYHTPYYSLSAWIKNYARQHPDLRPRHGYTAAMKKIVAKAMEYHEATTLDELLYLDHYASIMLIKTYWPDVKYPHIDFDPIYTWVFEEYLEVETKLRGYLRQVGIDPTDTLIELSEVYNGKLVDARKQSTVTGNDKMNVLNFLQNVSRNQKLSDVLQSIVNKQQPRPTIADKKNEERYYNFLLDDNIGCFEDNFKLLVAAQETTPRSERFESKNAINHNKNSPDNISYHTEYERSGKSSTDRNTGPGTEYGELDESWVLA